MDTSPEPLKVPGGSQDLKNQDKSLEVEKEAVTLDLQPEGNVVFECPGNCKEHEPCGSNNCNALGELHITDEGEEEEEEGVETSSWAEDEEEIVHTRSPVFQTSKAEFVTWNRRIERLRRQAIELHVSNLIFYRQCKNGNCIETFRRLTAQLFTEQSYKKTAA
jgi:hypothetical protein